MGKVSRRNFSLGLAAAGAASLSGPVSGPAGAQGPASATGHVVVVGGGVGGATVAHHVKKHAEDLVVTLVEPRQTYTTCFFSNLYLAGIRSLDSLTHTYDGLRSMGVEVIHQYASDIDAANRRVVLVDGKKIDFDRLVLAPGIDLKWGSIKGYDEKVAASMPHAWEAGDQTKILKQKLSALEDGDIVIMAVPPAPYRCPPAPYERAAVIAHFLKMNRPKSKLLVFDTKEQFWGKDLFVSGWSQHYSGFIEWVSPKTSGGGITRVDAKSGMVWLGNGEKLKPGLANIIPAQRTGEIAVKAGCAEGDWCPVQPGTFESKLQPGVYVLGDASNADDMPKSAFSAHAQSKVVANHILSRLTRRRNFPARFRNACWSWISPANSIKEGASYKPGKARIEVTSKFASSVKDASELRAQNYRESLGWYASVTQDMFAK